MDAAALASAQAGASSSSAAAALPAEGPARSQSQAHASGSAAHARASSSANAQHSSQQVEGEPLPTIRHVIEAAISYQRLAEKQASDSVPQPYAATSASASGSVPGASASAGVAAEAVAPAAIEGAEVATPSQPAQPTAPHATQTEPSSAQAQDASVPPQSQPQQAQQQALPPQPDMTAALAYAYQEAKYTLARDHFLPALNAQCRYGKGRGEEVLSSVDQQLSGADPLASLDATEHSLAYLFILSARMQRLRRTDAQAVRAQEPFLNEFCSRFDKFHVRLAPTRVHVLFKSIVQAGDLLNEPTWALAYLSSFLPRYVQEPDQLSSLHPMLLYQCLRTGAYAHAFELVLQYEIHHVPKRLYSLSVTDVLEYFYYGGLIFTKLGMWERAIELLDNCITVPSTTASAIQVEAVKTRVLVQLLKDGKTTALPRHTPDKVRNAASTSAQAYFHFAKTYESKRLQAKEDPWKAASECSKIFEDDRNAGLVLRCLEPYRRRCIQRISRMFSSISLEELQHLLGGTKPVSNEELQQEIAQANEDGWLNARIAAVPDSPTPFVFFETVPSALSLSDPATTSRKLAASMQEVEFWQRLVAEEERRIARSEPFITRLASSARPMGDAVDEDSAFS